ncbi:polysaccharide biosynthesis protein, partial [Bacillus paranthracis]
PILNMFFKHENIILKSDYKLIKIEQRDSVLTHQILGLIIYNGPIILISIFIDTNFASIFAVYSLIFGTFYSFFNLIYGQSLLPQLGHALSTKKEVKIKHMHEKFNKYSILIILVIMITTSIMFESFIQIYTSGADIDYYSYTTMLLFLGYTFINCLKVPYQTLVNANGDFKKTIIHSIVEVIVFILVIVIFWKFKSIDIFILGLLLSSTYKMVSLKIFSNIYIVKESWKQHYFQISGFLVLLIVSITVTTRIHLNINSLFEWVMSSVFTVILASVLSIVLILLPGFIFRKAIGKSNFTDDTKCDRDI